MQPDFPNNTGQNNPSRSVPSLSVSRDCPPLGAPGECEQPRNEQNAVCSTRPLPEPAGPCCTSPAPLRAQGTSQLCCCTGALHSVVLLCNQGFEVIFRHSQLGSRAIEGPQPVAAQQQLPGAAWLQHPAAPGSEWGCSEWECSEWGCSRGRTGTEPSQSSWPPQQPDHSSGVWDCSCSRAGVTALSSAGETEAPQLSVSGRMETPARCLERVWAV